MELELLQTTQFAIMRVYAKTQRMNSFRAVLEAACKIAKT